MNVLFWLLFGLTAIAYTKGLLRCLLLAIATAFGVVAVHDAIATVLAQIL